MNQDTQTIYRTTPARTTKMMVIMLSICIVGGVIFFSMWDYWTSYPAPVVGMMSETTEHNPTTAFSGVHLPMKLSFIESADFKTYAFNALPGEEGNNPTITGNVGDEINFEITNNGKSFHAFGITKSETGFAGIIPGSEVGTASNPMKPGQDGHLDFVLSEEGTFYYICTVPGHRDLGMVGKIIVGPSKSGQSTKAAAPTGVHYDFVADFIESADFKTYAFNSLPGEPGHNPEFKVKSGDEITFTVKNDGKSFHAFGIVSNPEDFNNVLWGSAIASASNPLKPGQEGQSTFIAGAPGTYYYICTVPGHAALGMQGSFIVE